MLIRDVMTANPKCCKPTDKLDYVAKLMVENDCGEIPVCDGPTLLGVITDRDITCRAVAAGRNPVVTSANEVMTRNVVTVGQDERVEDVLALMEKKLVRRVPVMDDLGKLCGIVSQADLVARIPSLKLARAMKTVAHKTRRRAATGL